jgi:hypothetical protein
LLAESDDSESLRRAIVAALDRSARDLEMYSSQLRGISGCYSIEAMVREHLVALASLARHAA